MTMIDGTDHPGQELGAKREQSYSHSTLSLILVWTTVLKGRDGGRERGRGREKEREGKYLPQRPVEGKGGGNEDTGGRRVVGIL